MLSQSSPDCYTCLPAGTARIARVLAFSIVFATPALVQVLLVSRYVVLQCQHLPPLLLKTEPEVIMRLLSLLIVGIS